MNEKLLLKEVEVLCQHCGESIDIIAHDCDINQNLVAKLFMETMKIILARVEEDSKK